MKKRILILSLLGFTFFTIFGQECAYCKSKDGSKNYTSQRYSKANTYNSRGQKTGYVKRTYSPRGNKTKKIEVFSTSGKREMYIRFK